MLDTDLNPFKYVRKYPSFILGQPSNPEAWTVERMGDARALMGLRELERFLGVSANTGEAVLKKTKAAYLQMKGGLIKISPVSIDHLLEQQAPLTLRQLAAVFGVDEYGVREARRTRELRCQLHQHSNDELRQACVVEFLRTCLNPGVSQRIKWYEHRLNSREPLLSVSEAAAFFDISEEQVESRIHDGKLRAIRLPGSNTEWRIAKNIR